MERAVRNQVIGKIWSEFTGLGVYIYGIVTVINHGSWNGLIPVHYS